MQGLISSYFTGRLSSLQALGGFAISLFSYIGLLLVMDSLIDNPGIMMIVTLAILLVELFLVISLVTRKLHDADISASWIILGIVPIVGLLAFVIVLFQPTLVANRYGKRVSGFQQIFLPKLPLKSGV